MKAIFAISLWISVLNSFQSAKGESRLIGSDDPIMVAPGTDVILPCRLEFEMDLVNKTIEWSRVGEKTEPAKQKSLKTYVFLYRRGIQITAMMMQSYIQRTSMFDDRLRRGDMSLKISNVTFEDNGIYECSLPRRQQRAKVLLVVSPNFPTTSTRKPLYFTDLPGNYRGNGNLLKIRPSIVVVFTLLGFYLALCLFIIIKREIHLDTREKKRTQ
ncbi:selection and upkeep of intraepithelial T-cells protein 2 isoform X2 [Oryzias melastigma]|uniref:selection and upkeep of intraepithelial T-cells protein 2 isoform X2 n=1 Tax=Oryzias melastigma TaxID=30732 RepID=UPI00168D2A99|nr:selection and upkeep of intraepithelial T-cells protein 2 isoform X2 [Oryzias melastigma]